MVLFRQLNSLSFGGAILKLQDHPYKLSIYIFIHLV